MQDTIRTKIDYAYAARILSETLNLTGSPVAFKIATHKESIPEGMAQITEQVRHCQMINMARREGKIFFATKDNHQCMGGSWALGLRDLSDSLRSGEFYYKLGKFDSWPSCKRTINNIPHLESGTTYATLYAPLDKTPFDPTLIMIVTNPKTMLKLAQASLYLIGGRINANFSGIQSVCADACAQVYLTGQINCSLGCDGSRKFSGIEDSEMVMGFPAERLVEIIEAIPVVCGAPGSS